MNSLYFALWVNIKGFGSVICGHYKEIVFQREARKLELYLGKHCIFTPENR